MSSSIVALSGDAGSLAYGLATLGPGIGVGLICGLSALAIARQPGMSGSIRQSMMLGLCIAESLALLGFIVPFVHGGG